MLNNQRVTGLTSSKGKYGKHGKMWVNGNNLIKASLNHVGLICNYPKVILKPVSKWDITMSQPCPVGNLFSPCSQ
jgi:hypothetical protein